MTMRATTQPDPVGNEVREARRLRRLGAKRVCAFCGHADLAALIAGNRRTTEEHHFLGRANDATRLVTLCLNCHAGATARQLNEGMSFGSPACLLDRVITVL